MHTSFSELANGFLFSFSIIFEHDTITLPNVLCDLSADILSSAVTLE